MQVEMTEKPEGWQPKTLSITFETKEEYCMFLEMLAYDVSIPETVYPESAENQCKLASLMNKIQEAMPV